MEITNSFRLWILINYPLFYPLTRMLKFKRVDKEMVACTDGSNVLIGNLIEKYEDKNKILLHEILHVGFMHNSRAPSIVNKYVSKYSSESVHQIVNIGADYIVNTYIRDKLDISIDNNFLLPQGLEKETLEYTLEEITDELIKKSVKIPHNYAGDIIGNDGRNIGQIKKIKRALMEGLVMSRKQRGVNSSDAEIYIEKLLKPEINWMKVLKKYLQHEKNKFSRSYSSVHKKSSLFEYKFIYPGIDKEKKKLNAVVVIDTSGSMNEKELIKCLSEVKSMYGNITIIQCDTVISNITVNNIPKSFVGRGGTSYIQPLKWILKNVKNKYTILLYFTDLYGDQDTTEFENLYKKVKKKVRKDFWIKVSEKKILNIYNTPYAKH